MGWGVVVGSKAAWRWLALHGLHRRLGGHPPRVRRSERREPAVGRAGRAAAAARPSLAPAAPLSSQPPALAPSLHPQDLASIQELLRPLEERGVLVKRSEEQLLR